jgi:gamma-glutamyltranspeptidase/glutathione hydrolase
MSPTIVLDKNDQPVLTVGAAGGPKIITQVLLTLIRTLDLDETLPSAIAAPRIHHQWQPDSILVEEAVPRSIVDGLKSLGHKIEMIDSSGATQGIWINREGRLEGVRDPRVPGKAGVAVR